MISLCLLAAAVLGIQAGSPLDKLDRKSIPADRRFEGQPEELVAVLGENIPYKDATNHRSLRVAFAAGGGMMGVTSDHTVQLWTLGDGAEKKAAAIPLSGYGEAWMFSPDGKTLAAAGGEPAVLLWDLTALPPKQKASLRPTAKGSMARDVAFTPDGRTLAVAHHEGIVRVWDLAAASTSPTSELRGHTSYLTRVVFSPDGRTLASGSRDKTVRLWDLPAADPKERASLGGHLDNLAVISFSPDGRLLASSGTEAPLRLWDLTGPLSREQVVLKGHRPYPNAVRSAVFLPDGKSLASVSTDGQVILWEVSGARKLKEWQLPGKFHGMVLTPEGRHLAVVSEAALVYVLRLSPPK